MTDSEFLQSQELKTVFIANDGSQRPLTSPSEVEQRDASFSASSAGPDVSVLVGRVSVGSDGQVSITDGSSRLAMVCSTVMIPREGERLAITEWNFIRFAPPIARTLPGSYWTASISEVEIRSSIGVGYIEFSQYDVLDPIPSQPTQSITGMSVSLFRSASRGDAPWKRSPACAHLECPVHSRVFNLSGRVSSISAITNPPPLEATDSSPPYFLVRLTDAGSETSSQSSSTESDDPFVVVIVVGDRSVAIRPSLVVGGDVVLTGVKFSRLQRDKSVALVKFDIESGSKLLHADSSVDFGTILFCHHLTHKKKSHAAP
jgi:hypothetical protein